MTIYSLPPLLVSIITISFGILAIFRGRQTKIKVSFSLMTLTVAIWLFGYSITYSAESYEMALIWVKVIYLGVIFIPVASYHFVVNFLNLKRSREVFLYYIIGVVFLILSQHKNFISGLYEYPWGYYAKASFLQNVFLVFFGIVMSKILYHLFVNSRKKRDDVSPAEFMRTRYLLFSFFIAIFAVFDFLPTYGIQFYPLGFICIAFYALLTTIAILRYRLLDINVMLTRAGLFIAVYALVLGVPFWLGYMTKIWLLPTILAIFLASSGPFIYTYVQRKAEQRLRFEEFKSHQQLNTLAQNMMRFTDLNFLLKLIIHELVKVMKLNSAYIYLKDQENAQYSLRSGWSLESAIPKQAKFLEDSALAKDILFRRAPVILEELKFDQTKTNLFHLKAMREELQKIKASVVIPAFKGDHLFGFLILGPRKGNRIFTREDLNLLMLLASQAVLAIENAQLFEREKLYLAEKSRRDALADMAPGVSHQFNNRFLAIESEANACLDILRVKPLRDLNKEELELLSDGMGQFLQMIKEDTVKGREIAQAIVAKGKAEVTFEKKALRPVIESAVKLLKLSRTRISLEGTPEPDIRLNIEEGLPQLILSSSLLEDVFYNLLDNARDAIVIKHRHIKENKLIADETPYEGKITISAKKETNRVIVTVNDNGIGIEKDKIKRLFTPYFTSKATAHKGTGLGLYIIQDLVAQHKGKISVESQYEKGTTFTMELPIRTGG
jgi:signal transduction histidine kinase